MFAETSADLNEAAMTSSSTHVDSLNNERSDLNDDSANEWNAVPKPGI